MDHQKYGLFFWLFQHSLSIFLWGSWGSTLVMFTICRGWEWRPGMGRGCRMEFSWQIRIAPLLSTGWYYFSYLNYLCYWYKLVNLLEEIAFSYDCGGPKPPTNIDLEQTLMLWGTLFSTPYVTPKGDRIVNSCAHFTVKCISCFKKKPGRHSIPFHEWSHMIERMLLLRNMSRITMWTLRRRFGSRRTFWWCHGETQGVIGQGGLFEVTSCFNGCVSDLGMMISAWYVYIIVLLYIYIHVYTTLTTIYLPFW